MHISTTNLCINPSVHTRNVEPKRTIKWLLAEAMVHESGILYYLFLSSVALDQEVCIQWPQGIKVLVLMSIL